MPEQNEQTKLLMQILEELRVLRELVQYVTKDGAAMVVETFSS